MSHLHSKSPRKKKDKKAPVTCAEVARAIQEFKERGGIIKKLPDELVMTRQKVGGTSRWSGPYEDINGMAMAQVPF